MASLTLGNQRLDFASALFMHKLTEVFANVKKMVAMISQCHLRNLMVTKF
jgi:hypothetical protein